MNMYTIYSRAGCGSCIKAKQFCEALGLSYIYMELGKDYQLSQFYELAPQNHKTFPLILEDNKYFGGLSTLEAKYKKV